MSGHRGPLDRSLRYGVRSWQSLCSPTDSSITTFLFLIHLPDFAASYLLPVSTGAGYISRASTDHDYSQRQPHPRRAYRVCNCFIVDLITTHNIPKYPRPTTPPRRQVTTAPLIPPSLEQAPSTPARSLCPPVSQELQVLKDNAVVAVVGISSSSSSLFPSPARALPSSPVPRVALRPLCPTNTTLTRPALRPPSSTTRRDRTLLTSLTAVTPCLPRRSPGSRAFRRASMLPPTTRSTSAR